MDADKIKNFFVSHVEKMIVAVVVAFSLFLIYQGFQMEDYRDQQDPDQLADTARTVRSQIDEDHTEAIIPERRPTFDIVARTNDAQKPVDSLAYNDIKKTWTLPNVDSTIRREDPTLYPPEDLIVRGYIGPVAKRSRSGTYELTSLEAAEPPEKVEKKPKPRKRRRGRGSQEDMFGMGYGSPAGSADMEGYPGGDYEAMGMGSEEEGSGSGSASMAGTGADWELDDKYDFGARPSGSKSLQAPSVDEQPVPAPGWFIAGTAVMPHRKVVEAFHAALRDAEAFRPDRDQPRYVDFQVQRADVTEKSVDELTDDDWILVGNRYDYTFDFASKWSGFAPEIVPPEYRDDAITTYIPPVLLDDYRDFSNHPKIPLSAEVDGEDEAIEEPVDVEELKKQFKIGSGGRSGGSGGGEMSGSGYESEMMGGPGGGGMYGSSGSYGGSYGGSMRIDLDPVDYKLMRFYDFFDPRSNKSPRPGRDYVYRLRFAINDPNFPASEVLQPKMGTLSADVFTRITPLRQKAEAEGSREPYAKRWSEWSQPSPPASLPDAVDYYAGPVTPAKKLRYNVGGETLEVDRDTPTAKIVTTRFDQTYSTDVPFWMDVTEGSVLSASGDASVVDPITLEIKKLPETKVVSGSTVIDIDGGRELEVSDDEEMTEPGVMLIFDEQGGLRVSGEVGDQLKYRMHSYADDRGL